MHIGRVLDDDHVVALRAAEPELGDGCGAVGQQPRPVFAVDPGAGHDLGAVERPDVVLEVRDDRVELVGVEEPVLDQHRLDSGDARLDRRQRLRVVRVAVVVIVVVVVIAVHEMPSR